MKKAPFSSKAPFLSPGCEVGLPPGSSVFVTKGRIMWSFPTMTVEFRQKVENMVAIPWAPSRKKRPGFWGEGGCWYFTNYAETPPIAWAVSTLTLSLDIPATFIGSARTRRGNGLNLRPPWSRKWNSGVVLNAFNLLQWCFNRTIPAKSPHSGVSVSP